MKQPERSAVCIYCYEHKLESEMEQVFRTGFIQDDHQEYPLGVCQTCSQIHDTGPKSAPDGAIRLSHS